MQIGVLIPIGNNGWLISTTSPQYKPSFALNRRITERAEHYGFDFALSMIKLRGFGGPSEYWDHNLESFTLMAGLAAVTSRIRLFASVAVLTVPPPITARMAVTIDSISGGRFGVNIVSGWQKAEYEQMGLWPGEAHFARRYDYCTEYVQVMRELWSTGRSDFQGSFFHMQDCRLSPRPGAAIPIICAGQSERGMRFAAVHGDFNFVSGTGLNDPARAVPNLARFNAEVARTRREVGALVLAMVIADETDAAAIARWEHYKAGTDHEALAWRRAQASADVKAETDSAAERFLRPENQLPTHMPTPVGSYATIAGLLDTIGAMPGVCGGIQSFDGFERGVDRFGTRIQPCMQSRAGVLAGVS